MLNQEDFLFPSKGSFKKYVHWGGEWGGSLKSKQNQTGEGFLAYMYVSAFYKKYWDFQSEVL